MSFAGGEDVEGEDFGLEVVVSGDVVEGKVCRAGDGAVVVAVLVCRKPSIRLRARCARHLRRIIESISSD